MSLKSLVNSKPSPIITVSNGYILSYISDKLEFIIATFILPTCRFKLDLDTSHEIQPHCAGLYTSKTGIKLKLYSAA